MRSPVRRSRLGCIARWTGVSVCAVLVITWVLSGWWGAARWGLNIGVGWTLSVEWGTLGVSLNNAPGMGRGPRWELHRVGGPRWYWIPDHNYTKITPGIWCDSWLLPLWIPFIVAAPPTAFLWRRHLVTRRSPGSCAKCGYSLADLPPGSVCPECGAAP